MDRFYLQYTRVEPESQQEPEEAEAQEERGAEAEAQVDEMEALEE